LLSWPFGRLALIFKLQEEIFSDYFDPPEILSEQHRSQWVTEVQMALLRQLMGPVAGLFGEPIGRAMGLGDNISTNSAQDTPRSWRIGI